MLHGLNNLSIDKIQKAKNLIDDVGVVKLEDDLFQVKSFTNPSNSYF